MTDKIDLTRRKILASIGGVGAAGATAGMGTSALFSDEESFENNSITAGTLDMTVDAKIPTDGINPEWSGAVGFGGYDPETADGEPGVGVTLGDMKPGDWVILCYEITVETNPACLSLGVENTANDDNGLTEPEENEDGDTTGGDGEGELAQNLEVTVYDDLTESNLDGSLSSAKNVALSNELLGGVTLNEVWSMFDGGGAIAADTQIYDFYLLLELPTSVGNIVQSDSVEWDFVFDAVQSRNNECDTPWKADAISISATPNTAGDDDSIHRVEIPVGSSLGGQTLSSIAVDYPTDFDLSNVDPGDVLGAGVQRLDSSIDSLSVNGTSASDSDTAIGFTLGGSVSVSSGETVFIEYLPVTNASTPDNYTVVVDVNGSEIGPGTLPISPASATPPTITTTFDSGDDGWEITGDAQGSSSVPDYESGTGNPAPSISATDDVQGGVWYFDAPGKYLSDKSDFYGGTLKYDLLQEFSQSDPNQFSAVDIELTGDGMTLTYDHGGTSSHPGGGTSGGWTSYSVTLDETDDWMISNSPASASEIQMVLSNLTELRIRGEYRTGEDKGYLDNVEMNP